LTYFGIPLDEISTEFTDVFVDDVIVDSLKTIVTLPLLYPQYFNTGVLAKEAIGGILLYGPPGTGKTMLCRALAKSSRAKMLHVKPSDINDMWVGESEKRVTAVFVSKADFCFYTGHEPELMAVFSPGTRA
jgi:SpoVK/Ycf46/Vps4 family AAA+-type ATPase